jgi:DMSO/TMAO reductase YedYZ molybdopterin-dependent catalytic subunit
MSVIHDNKFLPSPYGFPMKIRKSPSSASSSQNMMLAMEVTKTDLGGYWENYGHNWFGGL